MNSIIKWTPLLTRNKRLFATSRRFYTTELNTEQKKMGAVKGGLIGFLVGVSITGAIGYYYLLEEYNSASESLMKSVEELQHSTEKVRDYAQRIESIDKDLTNLKKTAATQQQLDESKIQLRKLYDTLNIEHLDLKTHVWGLEKDLNTLIVRK
ncbi:uncharacterized protein BX664DRAFT_322373 [Halteromyces radiatus]|uniref:uncharacterized protein n=1 Tax=Halteromyces radiatus TaxID=101107 RepID=UPI00221E7383|nr:uncharacterized protein BX664DRAFT_322373 [Halteromyces radiatus]KAI8099910.1 hypothetical protein BX664DRAFT_322373 [Halteromyces radiatus]